MTLPLSRSRVVAQAALVVAVLALGCKKTKPGDAGGDSNTNTPAATGTPGGGGAAPGASGPPAGWAEARDPVGGFKMYMFGRIQMLDPAKAGPEQQALQMSRMTNNLRSEDTAAKVYAFSLVPPAGFKFGAAPDELYAGLLLYRKDLEKFQVVLSKEPVQLGGRAALKVLTKPRNLAEGASLPSDPEAAKWVLESRKKDAAQRTTYFITTTATRVIIVQAQTAGDPDPAEFKILTDSFAFL